MTSNENQSKEKEKDVKNKGGERNVRGGGREIEGEENFGEFLLHFLFEFDCFLKCTQ